MPSRKNNTLTEESLREAAVTYALSYSCTESKLRRNMEGRVTRHCKRTGEDPSDFRNWIDASVSYCAEKGYVNDLDYAERYLDLAQEKGQSLRKARQKLAQRGVPQEIAQAGIEQFEFDDVAAAKAYARKKSIGMFRLSDRDQYRDRDLAALGRQGFGYEICRRIIEGEEDDDEL
jgi:regulatory protein